MRFTPVRFLVAITAFISVNVFAASNEEFAKELANPIASLAGVSAYAN